MSGPASAHLEVAAVRATGRVRGPAGRFVRSDEVLAPLGDAAAATRGDPSGLRALRDLL